jgi:hypothetical protein
VAATERVIRDPELRERLGAAGRATVAGRYDVSEQAVRLAGLFPGQDRAGILAAMPDANGVRTA